VHGQPIYAGEAAPARGHQKRAKAAIVVLARDSDCDGVLRSMEHMEARFNAKFGYPYVFLNNEPFGTDFVNR
jgi:alpha 1,2-mannosyltransferase